jgi:hypothetical protein
VQVVDWNGIEFSVVFGCFEFNFFTSPSRARDSHALRNANMPVIDKQTATKATYGSMINPTC